MISVIACNTRSHNLNLIAAKQEISDNQIKRQYARLIYKRMNGFNFIENDDMDMLRFRIMFNRFCNGYGVRRDFRRGIYYLVYHAFFRIYLTKEDLDFHLSN